MGIDPAQARPSGNADEWTPWLVEHGPALLLLARQWMSSRPDAEDVVQEGFLRFWRSRHRADDPVAYLYACIKRCAMEWHRAGCRRSRREEAAARNEVSGSQGLFLQRLEQDERRVAIETAMQSLPEAQREVLVMKIWGKLSFPQIARILAIPSNTAASRYRYALERLRLQLAKEPCYD
jgi:RNA polymerase sigma-70 factor (ECF subfamily)